MHSLHARRRRVRTPSMLALGIVASFAASCASALDVPATHPRLWFGDPARLAQARQYHQTHPIAIPGYPPSAAARNHALRFQMTGNAAECDTAIDWLMRFDFELPDEDGDGNADPGSCDLDSEGRYCDRARWTGEDAILTYDWCHAAMTSGERAAFISKWDRYIAALNVGPYGWRERPMNNYYWGYLRNAILYGIATMGGSARAQEFLDHGLNQRFTQYFVPWSQTYGQGGIPGEGTQYGAYPLGYSVIALRTVMDYGFDALSASAFFDHAAYYLTYATSPAPTFDNGRPNPKYELFPFNDDHDFAGGGSANSSDYADMLGALILREPASARARHARAGLARTGVAPSWWVAAALSGAPGPSGADDLPLDYFAAGYRFLYARTGRGAGATTAVFELGALGADERGGLEHDALEAGSFQIWRKGRFVSRETTGYRGSDYIRGLGDVGRTDVNRPAAHNTVLFNGGGQIPFFHAQPTVLRLQSADDYAYAAVDLRPGYRSHPGPVPTAQCWLVGDDWPFTDVAIREFIFLRAWSAVVVLDRMRSSDDSLLPVYANPCTPVSYTGVPAAQVKKTFVMHFAKLAPPTVAPGRVTSVNGDQAIDAHLLLPLAATPRIVDERNCNDCDVGQYRLEIDQAGSAEAYSLNVLQARDASAAPITASLVQQGLDWTVTLTRAGGDTVRVKLRGGLTSTGGSVQFGGDAPQPLLDRQQGMTVMPQGPVWESIPTGLVFANGYE